MTPLLFSGSSIKLNEVEELAKQELRKKKLKDSREKRRAKKRTKKTKPKQEPRVTRLAVKEAITGKRPLLPSTMKTMKSLYGVMRCAGCNSVYPHNHFCERGRSCRKCISESKGTDTLEKFARHIVKLAHDRSEYTGGGALVTQEWVVHRFNSIGGNCELCGGGMTYTKEKKDESSKFVIGQKNVSMDQIVDKAGYTETNVQLVHRQCNVMKMDLSMEEFLEVCRMVTKNYPCVK